MARGQVADGRCANAVAAEGAQDQSFGCGRALPDRDAVDVACDELAECYVLRGDVVVGQLLCVVSRAFSRAFLRVLLRGAWPVLPLAA